MSATAWLVSPTLTHDSPSVEGEAKARGTSSHFFPPVAEPLALFLHPFALRAFHVTFPNSFLPCLTLFLTFI